MSNDGVWVKVWPESDGGTGITGWAEITGITGTSGKRYTYDNWVAYEFIADGTVTTSDGLVDALLVGGGSYRTSVPRFCSGRVNQGLLPVSGLHNIQVGQGQQTQSATWGSGSAISGVVEQGPVPYPPTGGFVGAGTGPNQGVLSSITGTEVNYAAHSLSTPGGSSSTNGSPGFDGVVIVRVPAEFNKVTTLPAGWSEA